MSRICLCLAAAAFVVGCAMPSPVSTQNASPAPAELRRLVGESGSLRVIVTLVEDGQGPASAESIRSTQDRLLAALRTTKHGVVHRYSAAPILALEVGRDGLEVLLSSPLITSIRLDAPRRPQ
jgi:hypothetical protein